MRDPFFKMLPRSLSNFMNALTSADHTSYPFATTNRQDYKNLLSVYLDATLHPLLNEKDFLQEGWRIGPKNPKVDFGGEHSRDDLDNNLVFKGVVYNEMKGQMSDSGYLYYIKFLERVFPAINNSGGDPRKMTDLTYAKLKDFHSSNYHPSNAKIFTYGDTPLEDHLAMIGQELDQFKRAEADKTIKTPRSLGDGPFYHTIKGPRDTFVDSNMQYKTSTSWLVGQTSDLVEMFSLRIIASILIDGYGSPLYQALIESGLGPDWSPNTGLHSYGDRAIFSVGLSGVKEADVPNVKNAILSKIREVHKKGFDRGKVGGILHQLELALRHKTANFGIGLVERLEPGWFNGVDLFDALSVDETLAAFKRKYATPGYLEGLLEKFLLNDRTLTFTMEPSDNYSQELDAEEGLRLAAKLTEASKKGGGVSEARKKLIAQEAELLEVQSKEQDLGCLPSVHVRDVPREREKKPVRISSLGHVKVQWREAATNGLTYFRGINSLVGLPSELRMLVPLFAESVMRLGTKSKTMEELEDLMNLKTGGIQVTYHASPAPTDRSALHEGIAFVGSALDANVPAMYELLRIIIQETDFDGPGAESKIRQLLQSSASGAIDLVAGSGDSFASMYASAGFSPIGRMSEQTQGLTHVQHDGELANRSPVLGLEDVIAKLKTIQEIAIENASNFRGAITCGKGAVSPNEAALQNFLAGFPSSAGMPKDTGGHDAVSFSPKTFFSLPYQVYYSACTLPTVSYSDPSGAALQVLAELLTHEVLHQEIREKGGAYGGSAYAAPLSGTFGVRSYRDPNPQNTLNIVRDVTHRAATHEWTDGELERAKLSVFQAVDAPVSVSEEGMARFLNRITDEMLQRKREQLLDVTKADLRDVAQKHLVEGWKDARIAVLGEKKDWVRESDGWTVKSLKLSQPSEFAGASDMSDGDLRRT